MGKVFLVRKEELIFDEVVPNSYIVKGTPLNEDEADALIVIQKRIKSEITEPISEWRKDSLTQKSRYEFKGLVFCFAKDEQNQCIGYGYGYLDTSQKKTFYIDTIGVSPEHRKKGVGTRIKVKLAQHAFANSEIEFVKAITQSDNDPTIAINAKLGFKSVEES